jgi:hypothetical protein
MYVARLPAAQLPLTDAPQQIDYVWTVPKKLMTYMYSTMFVILGGSHANALVFGLGVIQASTPPNAQVDFRLQKLFAILLVAVVCLFQSFSRLNYIRFSDVFALYKISLFSVITILGFYVLANAARKSSTYGVQNLQDSFSGATTSPYVIAIAILDIMRVYSGYENVNFVSGPLATKMVFIFCTPLCVLTFSAHTMTFTSELTLLS